MSQQFCLKWNNHMNNMMDVFKSLLSTESMVDVTLACDGLSLKAHKMVLSACSPFFQALFLENPCKHPIVILKDMKYTELKAIIEFMYHGEVNVAQDQLSALMKTAETLRVKGLAEVTNEKNSQSNNSAQDEPGHRSVPRTDTPPPSKRRRGRTRKRSLSDSNRSDDDSNEPKIKQPMSPEIEELSGDMDASSSQFSQSHVPMQSTPSHSSNTYHKSSSVISQDPQIEEPTSADESEFGVEPAKLLEQTLTTEELNARRRSEMQRRSRSSTDHGTIVPTPSISSDVSNQQPDSPIDVKPELLELDPPPGSSHSDDNSMMMYMDQSSTSHPGPSGYQDNTALVPQDSQNQDFENYSMSFAANFYDPENENTEISLTQSKNKRVRLVVDQFHYRINKHNANTIFWECIDSKRLGCKARMSSRGYEISRKNDHNHESPTADVKPFSKPLKKKMKPNLKKYSKEKVLSTTYYRKKKKAMIKGVQKKPQPIEDCEFELVRSVRGNVLKYKSYTFTNERQSKGGKIYWRCNRSQKLRCKARIHTLRNKIIFILESHNHEPPPCNT